MTRPPLELLLEDWETRARQLNENSRTEDDAHLSWYYGGRAAELSDCIQALRAQAEAEANERARLSNVLERDRTQVAGGVAALGRVLEGYQWLTEGRGPYAYDDDRYQQEFGNALRDLAQALEPLRLIGHDLTDCPTLWADVQSARRGLSAPAQADAGGEG